MIMKLGNVNIDDGSNILAKNRDSPRSNEGVIFLSNQFQRFYLFLNFKMQYSMQKSILQSRNAYFNVQLISPTS